MDTALDKSDLEVVATSGDQTRQAWSPFVGLKERSQLTAADMERIEQTAFAHSHSPESYDIVGSMGSLLETPCQQGLMNVFVNGKYWHVSGGVIAPNKMQPVIVNWIKQISARQRQVIALYSVTEEDLPLYVDAGFEVTKFGEEPILNLGELDWKGKKFEWVRRQTNYCKRAGLTVSEISRVEADSELARELNEVLHEDLKYRSYPKPLRLLVGEFDPEALHQKRLFVARSPEHDRVEALLACSPMNGGTSWSFEMYRKRKNSPRGAIPFLFRTVIDQFQAEGIQKISLCIVPGRGVHEWEYGEYDKTSWLARTSLSIWYRHFSFLFNAKGQDHFKSRFRPEYQNRYICVAPGTTVGSILSFVDTVGVLIPHPGNLLRNLLRRKR